MKVIVFIFTMIIGSIIGILLAQGSIYFYDKANLVIPVKKDWVQELAKKDMQEYMKCKQAQSYEYMKYHRDMIRNLIKEEKYDKEDSFWVDNSEGGYELFYYTIGGYEFQKDGTLFGKKVLMTATEILEP